MEPGLECSTADGIATITLRNPAKRNAMTPSMWRELPPLLAELAATSQVHAVVLTGYGATFCAGADIGSFSPDVDVQDLAVRAEEALAGFPGPTLAVVRGHCVGGGAQLAVACDLRFADEDARFGVTPARLGVVYAASSTQRLVRLAGPSATKHLLYSAELIGAARALRIGLADEVLPAGALEARVAEFTALLVSRSRLTQFTAKEYVDGPPDPERQRHWEHVARESGELAEGAAAFLERRPARFPWSP
ncbi:enoyl-CoA hydratase/isomerase family protein [Streptomyces sp. P38-E01]|uniref:Enoyl-CoA hydratase/isomerase family protein n=1 Tax=Streptomyces tardus TaxID=2780544 RepID=A0A949N749_9ACTN|nr:enoyl-CoA hydratase/isomerase family protein [Streptomyces tardus]MBU7600664.1 enoyl-CoA hydratase/isomerase family protein [Streptomyces tardus]